MNWWSDFARRPGARFGLGVTGLLLLLSAGADFLASDKPLVLHLDGQTYVLPNLTDPVALRTHTNQSLLETMGPEDWMIAPPIPWGVNQQDIGRPTLEPPSASHWLGTDTARRDVLARMIHGCRVTLLVGGLAVAFYILIGTALGATAGYFGGWVDAVVSRVTELVMSIPVLFVILAVMGMVEDAGLTGLVVVIGAVYWTRVARLVRAEVLRLREMDFVRAAEILGYSHARILIRHILPNALAPILVSTAFGLAGMVLVEAALSFLGFGTPDTLASWGGLLRGAMGNFQAWWLVVFPGLGVFVTVLGYNLAGEALRDALDPRLRSRDTRAF